jgi:predicted dithiol-disulfide oxidoreductase (DUF899 family)
VTYRETTAKLAELRSQLTAIRHEMRKVQAKIEPQPVQDYQFETIDKPVRTSQLFGAKQELFVIHNMGRSCSSCTLWADGFNGIYPHISDRAAFILSTPDAPDVQRDFAAGRGWRMPLVSHRGTSFASDMGYRSAAGGWLPGVSVFRRERDKILRVADTRFEPGDDFCAAWHLFDLLPEGADGWQPKFAYP